MDRIALSVVIPAYDEERRIGVTLERVLIYLGARGAPFEVLVADDGSSDGTAAVVERFARARPQVKLLASAQNQGKGAAVRRGVLAAKGARVLMSDADLSTPIEELEKLERALDGGAEIAIGSRALPASDLQIRQSAAREAMGKTFNGIIRVLGLSAFHDTQCGFKLFDAAAARDLFGRARVDGFAFDVEILLLAEGLYRVAEIPVVWRNDDHSRVSPFRDSLRMLFDVLRLRLGG